MPRPAVAEDGILRAVYQRSRIGLPDIHAYLRMSSPITSGAPVHLALGEAPNLYIPLSERRPTIVTDDELRDAMHNLALMSGREPIAWGVDSDVLAAEITAVRREIDSEMAAVRVKA